MIALLVACTLPPAEPLPEAAWTTGCVAYTCPGADEQVFAPEYGSCEWDCATYGLESHVAVSVDFERWGDCWEQTRAEVSDGRCDWW